MKNSAPSPIVTHDSRSRIAAIFDLDGTLLPLPSLERRFLAWLRWRRGISPRAATRWLTHFAFNLPHGFTRAFYANKSHLAGLTPAVFDEFAEFFARRPLPFFPAALRRLEWHARAGHQLLLITGTLAPLARIVAAQLPVPVSLFASELESLPHDSPAANSQKYFSGRLSAGPYIGPAKARLLSQLTQSCSLDLAQSFAYADRASDLYLLSLVAFPAAVNPDPCLARIARRSGWTTLDWAPSSAALSHPLRENLARQNSRFRFVPSSLNISSQGNAR